MGFTPSALQASDVVTALRGRTRLGVRPPNVALQDEEMYRVLNSVNEWFVYWALDKEGVQPLKRFRRSMLIKPKAHTTLSADAAAAANTLELLDGDDFGTPSATTPLGAVIKNSDGAYEFITYEARSGDDISELATLSTDFEEGDEVHLLYGLNENFGQPRVLSANNQRPFIYRDGEFDNMPPPGHFHVKWLESKSLVLRPFIVLPDDISTGLTFTLYYVKRPKDISVAADKLDALAGWEREAILEKMSEYVWSVRGEADLEQKARLKADEWMGMIHSKESQFDASPDQGPQFDMSIDS